jgi:putative ABC transport system ATP-binding protein
MAQIEALGLSRVYSSQADNVMALRNIDLAIEPGEYLAVMGPSGSGKTTLMNLLGLLDSPTSGQLVIEGQDVVHLSPDARATIRNRRIGFVFQTYSLLPRWTALENVELPLVYAGLRSDERIVQARDMLAAVGLENRMKHWPAQLSGGELQRVAIARAMVSRPAILLADEPTGALDSETGAQVLELLGQLNANGTTVVLVTHDPLVAMEARRVLRMRDGEFEELAVSSEAPNPSAQESGDASIAESQE